MAVTGVWQIHNTVGPLFFWEVFYTTPTYTFNNWSMVYRFFVLLLKCFICNPFNLYKNWQWNITVLFFFVTFYGAKRNGLVWCETLQKLFFKVKWLQMHDTCSKMVISEHKNIKTVWSLDSIATQMTFVEQL